jgi:hypothetical protein
MATYVEVLDETDKVFREVLMTTTLERYLKVQLLADNGLKEIGKVVKANDLVKYVSDKDIIVIINEDIFLQLEDVQQLMVAESLLAGISFDTEKDKIVINQPDVKVHSLILRKFTYAHYERLQESIKTLFEVKENKGEESSEPAQA